MPTRDEIDAYLSDASARHGVPVDVMRRLMGVESGGDPSAVSYKGARGLLQVMPGTFAEMGGTDPSDWRQQIETGTRYFGENLRRFGGDLRLAAAAYHAGPGAVEKAGGIPRTSDGIMRTSDYVDRILAGRARQLPALEGPQDVYDPSTMEDASGWGAAMARRELPPAPPPRAGVWEDTKNLLWGGAVGTVQDFLTVVRSALGDDVANKIDAFDKTLTGSTFAERQAAAMSRLSPEMTEALGKEWWDDEKGTFGSAVSDWRSWYGGLMQSLPGTAAIMLPGMWAGRAVQLSTLAKAGFDKAAAKALIVSGGRTAAEKALLERASLAGARTAMVAGALLEGTQGGAQSSREVRDQIMALPDATLDQSEAFRAALADNGGDRAAARRQLARDRAGLAFLASGVVTGAFGGAGDRIIARMWLGREGGNLGLRILKGAVAEGVFEEFPQSYGQQVAQNIGMQAIDPNLPATQGALSQGIGGLAVGGLMGGGMGAVFGRNVRELPPQPAGEQPPQPAAPAAEPPPEEPSAPSAPMVGEVAPGDIMHPVSHKPFKDRLVAEHARARMGAKETHEVVQVGPDAWVLRPLAPAAPAQEEPQNAVQIEGAGPVDVGQPPADGEGVGQPYAEPAQPAGAVQPATEAPPAAAPEAQIAPGDQVREIALQAQRDAGWDPSWPFIPADLVNADFRERIQADPGLTDGEKARIFEAGRKLGVVPTESPGSPPGSQVSPPGSPVSPPGSPVSPPGSPVSQPGSPVSQPGSPVSQPGSPGSPLVAPDKAKALADLETAVGELGGLGIATPAQEPKTATAPASPAAETTGATPAPTAPLILPFDFVDAANKKGNSANIANAEYGKKGPVSVRVVEHGGKRWVPVGGVYGGAPNAVRVDVYELAPDGSLPPRPPGPGKPGDDFYHGLRVKVGRETYQLKGSERQWQTEEYAAAERRREQQRAEEEAKLPLPPADGNYPFTEEPADQERGIVRGRRDYPLDYRGMSRGEVYAAIAKTATPDVKGRAPNDSGVYEPTETLNGPDGLTIQLVELKGGAWLLATRRFGSSYAPSMRGPHFASRDAAIRAGVAEITPRQGSQNKLSAKAAKWLDSIEPKDEGGKAAASTAPAPAAEAAGATPAETKQIGDEFDAAREGGEQVHHLFDSPGKSEVVRLQDKVKVYHAKHGWMTPAQAKKKIAEWKAHAAKQGESRTNADKVVLSLFDLTGAWSQPWEDAGYNVFRFDIQNDPEGGDVNKFSTEFFNDWWGDFDGQDIYAILAACPCTDFAVSGARHFAAKDADGRTRSSVELVRQTLATIEHFKPAIWAIENPVGRIEKLTGLPPWRLSFDPNHFGDPYTKKTLLWGRFNADLPIAPVEPTEGSKMWAKYGGKSDATKNARSITPEGFAYSFFMANNAIDHRLMALANKYDRLDPTAIKAAIDRGLTDDQISDLVDDFYYMDLDDVAANKALRGSTTTPPKGGKAAPAEAPPKAPRQPKQERTPEEKARVILIRGLKQMGGIRSTEARDITGEGAVNANRLLPGLFRKAGHSMDRVAEWLHQYGYMTDAEYEDVDGGMQRARDIVRELLDKRPVVRIKDMDDIAQRDLAAQLEEAYPDAGLSENEIRDLLDSNPDATTAEVEAAFDIDAALTEAGIMDESARETIKERAAIAAENGENYEAAAQTAIQRHLEGAQRDRGQAQGEAAAGEDFQLAGQTNAEVLAAEEARRKAAEEKAKADAAAEQKAKIDAERDGFTLSGSNRPADVLAAQGQGDLLSAPPGANVTVPAQPPAPSYTPTDVPTQPAAAEAWPFKEVSRRKVGGGAKTTPADEVTWTGVFDGRTITLVSTVRTQMPNATFYTYSNARIRGDWINPIAGAHYIDIQAPADLTDEQLQRIADMQTVDPRPTLVRRKGEPVRTGVTPAAPAPTASSPEKQKALDDLKSALGDLGDLLGDITGARKKITPEQEQKLLPILTRAFDAAFRAGYYTFRDAARAVLAAIRAQLGDPVADALSLDHLQGAYIAMAGRYREQGADRPQAVLSVESKEGLEAPEEAPNAADGGPVLEPDRGAGTPQPLWGEVLPPQPGGAESGPSGGVRPAGEGGGGSAGGAVVPGTRPAGGRTRGDQQVRPEQPSGATGAPGSDVRDGGSAAGDLFGSSEPDAGESVVPPARESAVDEEGRLAAQRAADRHPIKVGDRKNIADTLPYLHTGQQDDVAFAEARLSKPTGYGVLFTNGTGTGKTFTGLGIIKRYARQGMTDTIIVVPNDQLISDWVTRGKRLGLTITPLESTKDAGKGIVVTTYANFGQNPTLGSRQFKLMVMDEAQNLSANEEGELTLAANTMRGLAMREEWGYSAMRLREPRLTADLDAASEAAKGRAASMEAIARASELSKRWHARREELQGEYAALPPEERPRAVFLSATPFAYQKSIEWGQGWLWDWNEGADTSRQGAYNAPDGREQFFIRHFGYRMRYGKLTQPDSAVQNAIMEIEFNSWLKREGVLSGRILDVDHDYSRRFVMAEDAIGKKIDEALEKLRNWDRQGDKRDPERSKIAAGIQSQFDYLSKAFLLESLKARHAVDMAKRHMAMGRKVVVFHDFNKGGGFHPFRIADAPESATDAVKKAVADYKRDFADVIALDFNGLLSPLQRFQRDLPGVLMFNGTISKGERRKTLAKFNDDASGPQTILVQADAGGAGVSLHDTTGKHQRVLINLGMPVKPVSAVQQEGRIYRVGQRSDAPFIYLNTGTNWERFAFATKIAERAGTAENLAMGELARRLRESFAEAFDEAAIDYAPSADEGKGGKERDRREESLSPYTRAKTFYFGQEKKNSRTKAREGLDYYATPEPLGLKMVQWGAPRAGDKILEPSAGHGAISRWFPETADRTIIEPSDALASRAALVSPGAQVISDTFESHHVGGNKYDVIVMNPPFGTAGRTAVDHIAKAFQHLRDRGRIVAVLPEGAALEKFDKWFASEDAAGAQLVARVRLPAVAFKRAGTGVKAQVVVIDRYLDPKEVPNVMTRDRDYADAEDINHFFDQIEFTELPDRPEPKVEEPLTPSVADDGKVHIPHSVTALRELLPENTPDTVLAAIDQSREYGVAQPFEMRNGSKGIKWTWISGTLKFPKVALEHAKHWAEQHASKTEKEGGGRVRYVIPLKDNVNNDKTNKLALTITGTKMKLERFVYHYDAATVPKQAAAGAPEAAPGALLEAAQTKHTKTGADLYVARIARFVERSVYERLNAIAKANGGYYSTFKGKGAIPGFQFNSAAERDAFIKAASDNLEVRETESGYGGAAAQTTTPEFKRWFGDSKVVDADGRPLRVYHGTTRWELPDGRQLGDITTFDRLASVNIVRRRASIDTIGTWFSTNPGEAGASMYAFGGAVYPVYLSIQNPYVTTFEMMVRRGHMLAGTPTGDVTESGVTRSAAQRFGKEQVDALRAWLKGTGQDGIKIVHDPKSTSAEFNEQDAWLALEPTQIKSATGNSGAFDPNDPSILREEDASYASDYRDVAPLWQSELATALQTKAPFAKNGTIAADQLARWLDARAKDGTVKPDELEWTGIKEWLALQGKVSRADVQAFLDQNGVRVEEKMLSDDERDKLDRQNAREALQEDGIENPTEAQIDEFLNEHGYDLGNVRDSDFAGSPKFASYQLPGGANYRELLLTLPERDPDFRIDDFIDRMADKYGMDKVFEPHPDMLGSIVRSNFEDALTQEERKELALLQRTKRPDTPMFRSGHFDEPNVLAHVRFNERTDADGKRVLFIEEIQSDWAQRGRREGFGGSIEELTKEWQAWQKAQGMEPASADEVDPRDVTPAQAEYIRNFVSRWNDAERGQSGTPRAPFVGKTDAWVALALKRMIRYAADNGFDAVAWTTGKQQADRYDLSEQVESVAYQKRGDKYAISVRKRGRPDGRSEELGEFDADKLADVVGKELAEKIVRGEGEPTGFYGEDKGRKKFEGLDLKVGGEGMRGFYDQIVPKVANSILKKLGGGTVGTVNIPAQGAYDKYDGIQNGAVVWTFDSHYAAQRWVENEPGRSIRPAGSLPMKQPGLDITPALRERAMEGMPLFLSDVRFRRTINDLIAATLTAADWADWYDRYQADLVTLFGEDAPLFRRFMAATSQRNGVANNVTAALKAYRQHLAGQPFHGFMQPVIRNLERAVAEQELNGPKIGQFDRATGADEEAMAVDRHVAELLFGTKNPTRAQHRAAWRRIRQIAAELGMAPRQVQAALWAYNQMRKGVEPKSYDTFLQAKAEQIAALRAAYGRGEGAGVQGRGADPGRAGVQDPGGGRDAGEVESGALGDGQAAAAAAAPAADAVRGAGGAVQRRPVVRANIVAAEIQRVGSAALVGRTISSAQDLADLAQVYRDPRYETIRWFFTKGDTVVHATGVSSRMPGQVPLVPKGLSAAQYIALLRWHMTRTGADGWFMLHNHPSGNPTPSDADLNVTEYLATHISGFRGHVVINTNKYAVINADGKADVIARDFGPDRLTKPRAGIFSVSVNGFDDLAALGRALKRPGWITLVGTGALNDVRVVADAPEAIVTRSKTYLMAMVRRLMRQSGSTNISLVGPERVVLSTLVEDAVRNGILRDAATENAGPKTVREMGVGPYRNVLGDTQARHVAEPGAAYGRRRTHGPPPARLATLPAAVQETLRKVGVGVTARSLRERFDELTANWQLKLHQGVLDQFAAIKRLSEKAYMFARLTKSASAPLEGALHFGIPFLNDAGAIQLRPVEGGLVKALRDAVGSELDLALAWIAGKRAAELKREGRENLLTDDDISNLENLNEGRMPDGRSRVEAYAQAQRAIRQWGKAILDLAEKAEIIEPTHWVVFDQAGDMAGDFKTEEEAGALAAEIGGAVQIQGRGLWEKEFYVPFYRIAEGETEAKGPMVGTSGLTNQQAFRRLKGGRQQINDLMENTLRNWAHLLEASLKNQAANETLIEGVYAGIAEPVSAAAAGKDAPFTLVEGRRQFWRVNDPLVLAAISQLRVTPFQGAIPQIMGQFKRLLTLGVTTNPAYRVRNLVRDSIQAVAVNPVSFNILDNLVTGWRGTGKADPDYAQALAGGGFMHFGTGLETNLTALTKRLIDGGVQGHTIVDNERKAAQMVKAAWTWWEDFGSRTENVNRAAIYKSARDRALAAGMSEAEAHLRGAYAARDSMDFSLHGAMPTIRFLTQVVPFFNSRLQGLYKLGREGLAPSARVVIDKLRGRQPAREDVARAARFNAVVGATALASVAILLMHRDDDEWRQREEWDRDSYWAVRIGDALYRIPKPFEVGALASVIERGTEAMLDGLGPAERERFARRVWRILMDQLSMDLRPQAVKPWLEVYANKDSFTGRPIETLAMESLPKADRASGRTSMIARGLGNALLSPAEIDHLVYGYLGWLGGHTLLWSDFALRALTGQPSRPAWRPENYLEAAGLRGFVQSLPQRQSRWVTQFYEQANEVQQAAAAVRYYERLGDKEKAARLRQRDAELIKLAPAYGKAQRSMTEINRQIRAIEAGGLSPVEKRLRLQRLYDVRNRIAKRLEVSREAALDR